MFFGCSPCCGGGGGGGGCFQNIQNSIDLFDGVLVRLGPVTTADYSFHFEVKFPWSVIFDDQRMLYNFRRTYSNNPSGHTIPGADVINSQGNGTSSSWRLQRLVFEYRCYSFSDKITFTPSGVSPADRGFLRFQIIFGSDNYGPFGEGVYHSGVQRSTGVGGEYANWIADSNLLSQGQMMGFDLNTNGAQTWIQLQQTQRITQRIFQSSLGSPFAPNPRLASCELYSN